jgi:hypothetical protein
MDNLIGLPYYINQFGDPYRKAVMWGELLRGMWLKQMMYQKRVEDARMFVGTNLCFIIKNGEIVKLTHNDSIIYAKP